MKKYFIKTFGCQMNISDSERIVGFLNEQGHKLTSDISEASLVIFNTCGVRQAAENRVYSLIHNLRKLPTKNQKPKTIILTGCLANRKDVQRRLKGKVDLFFPIIDFHIFENFVIENSFKIENLKLKISAQKNITNKESIAYLSLDPKYSNAFQAFVPIMTGCNNFCSYCVVPYARGRETSRPAEEILDEIKSLVKLGYKSITLLGQNVNSYNSPIDTNSKRIRTNTNFAQLLKKIDAIPGKFWIQFVSSHPKDMSNELIEVVAKSKKVCEAVHLPIQSGSDEILQKMNRKYTAKHYLNLVRKIKSAFKKYKPGMPFALTSDIIVGFPGETKKQFLCSAEIMQKAKFDMVFFGQFSPRPGTAAWTMKDNVSDAEKEKREAFLNEILKKTTFANNKKYLNTVQEVLIEKKQLTDNKQINNKSKQIIYFGKTRTGKNIKIISNKKDLVDQFVQVKITSIKIWNLEGKL
ncbi:MAG: (Dimethylallyl)adenosine tRNA methylthiotransferase MiaB [Candidatus Moranbacteria bacterium GW2011_GWA2_39_41]|nr:MAG: (Dimethylallyl)adenosine tRNA methylthiotransferase MiaB [Candidatus Moranbacteria bacterium GW2011_GWA2_39_41]